MLPPMKRIAVLVVVLLSFPLSPARAQESADDRYVIVYGLIEQADSLQDSGSPVQALAAYVQAQAELEKFSKINPDWNTNIIKYRKSYLAEKIADLTPRVPAAPATNAPPVANPPAPAPAAMAPATNAVLQGQVGDLQAQLQNLQAQIQNLQADNTTLAAKLKEALAAQPAVIDARELARARERARQLMKENDLLKVSLAQGKGAVVTQPGFNTNAAAQMQQALGTANQKLAAEMARADQLAQENETLRAQRQAVLKGPTAVEALREENALLRQQVAELRAATNALASSVNLELINARAEITLLRSNAKVGALEKTALENRVQQLQSGKAPAPASAPSATQVDYEARIRALTQERDNLLAKLSQTNEMLYGHKSQDLAARIDQLTEQVNTLRARIAVDEAQVVPYSTGELALFRQPAPVAANPEAEKRSVKELPQGSAALAAEAQKYFANKQYDLAEADYRQILERDQNNGLVLANLAAIELQQNKLDDAEKHVQAALAQATNDAYNLTVFGEIKLRQGKYDDALDALSRAAKLDPQNPEIQTGLGFALSHKGLRQQAETALRKAVQLNPYYAAAHNDLAVIYITQQPPLPALARWHYQKALDAGWPRNPDLEKLLSEKGAPATQ